MGPPPKDPRIRQRRNKVTTRTTVEDMGAPVAHPGDDPAPVRVLPRRACRSCPTVSPRRGRPPARDLGCMCGGTGVVPWHPRTEAWWRDVWDPATNPFVDQYMPTDAHGLEQIAILRDRINWQEADPDLNDLKELRLREPRFGLDVMGRRSLQWEIRRPAAPKPVPVAKAADGTVPTVDPRKVLFMDPPGGSRA